MFATTYTVTFFNTCINFARGIGVGFLFSLSLTNPGNSAMIISNAIPTEKSMIGTS